MKPVTSHAARELASALPPQAAAPLSHFEDLVGELIEVGTQCYERIEELFEYLHEPSFGLLGVRRALWQRAIKNAVARAWKGDSLLLNAVKEIVLWKIRAGIPLVLLANLKAERK